MCECYVFKTIHIKDFGLSDSYILNFWYVLQVSPLTDIDKILDCEMRPTQDSDGDGEGDGDGDTTKSGSKQIFVKQYLVKWKGLSYLHCAW